MYASIKIIDDNYNEQQQNLITIWDTNLKAFKKGVTLLNTIVFQKQRDKNKTIAGLKYKVQRYLNDNMILISMTIEDYILLMAKMGINIKIKEVIENE